MIPFKFKHTPNLSRRSRLFWNVSFNSISCKLNEMISHITFVTAVEPPTSQGNHGSSSFQISEGLFFFLGGVVMLIILVILLYVFRRHIIPANLMKMRAPTQQHLGTQNKYPHITMILKSKSVFYMIVEWFLLLSDICYLFLSYHCFFCQGNKLLNQQRWWKW